MALADYRQTKFGLPSLDDLKDWAGEALDKAWSVSPYGVTSEFLGGPTPSDIGGGITGVTDAAGLTNTEQQNEAYEQAQETLEQLMAQSGQTYGQAQQMLAGTRQTIEDIIGPENVEAYKAMVSGIEPTAYGASTDPLTGFEFERDVSKYMDPSAQYQIDQSVNAALQAMSGMGGLTGGAAARALQAEASQKASELYGDAWERMMKATEQEYGRARDVVGAEQEAGRMASEREKFKTEQLGNLFGSYVGNMQGRTEDIVNLLMSQMQTNASLSQALEQLGIDQASAPTGLQQLLGMAGQGAQIYSAVK